MYFILFVFCSFFLIYVHYDYITSHKRPFRSI